MKFDFNDSLVAREIPRTIATASGKENLDFFVKHLHLDLWFDTALIVYDDGLRPGKPAADFYLQAALNLGLNQACCVVVEDSVSGIAAAQEAGIGYVIALGRWDKHTSRVNLVGVDQVVGSLVEVPWKRLFL